MVGRFEVRSSLDDGVVFPVASVEREARRRRITARMAARIIVRQNTDPLTAETLFVAEVDDAKSP